MVGITCFIRIISAIESFILSIRVFKILAKKTVIFHLSRAINLTRSIMTTLIPG